MLPSTTIVKGRRRFFEDEDEDDKEDIKRPEIRDEEAIIRGRKIEINLIDSTSWFLIAFLPGDKKSFSLVRILRTEEKSLDDQVISLRALMRFCSRLITAHGLNTHFSLPKCAASSDKSP